MAKTNKASWVYLAEQYDKLVKPPSRPCRQQLRIWDKIIKKHMGKKGGNALILGATPELRDLALKNGYFTWAIDINPVMLKGMTKLMKRANPKREKRTVADWCKIKLPKRHFDLIMADASLNNVLSDGGNKKVLRLIAKSLEKDGICLVRNVVTRSLERPRPVKYWFDLIKNEKLNYPSDFTVAVRADSSASPFKKSPQVVDSVKVYKEILKQDINNSRIKRFLDFYYQVLGKERKYFFIYLKSDFEKLLKKYFKVLPIAKCQKHYSCQTIFPVYLLVKK